MHLVEALRSKELLWSEVNLDCLRTLRKELEFAVQTGVNQPGPSVTYCDEQRALAREAAGRTMVLLRNEIIPGDNTPLLQVALGVYSTIVILGRLSKIANTDNKGSSQVFPPHVAAAVESIRAAFPGAEILFDDTDCLES